MNTEKAPAETSKSGKKTRRRVRVSCVECTKRRQKCDRNVPCSLCVSRGVAHLCRWESIPVVRPPVGRPPSTAPVASSTSNDSDAIIKELSARVALLEKELAQKTLGNASTSSVALTSNSVGHAGSESSSMRASPEPPHTHLHSTPPPPPPPPALPSTSLPLPSEHISIEDVRNSILPAVFFEDPLYETAATLAQLAVGHYGEFIGRGSLICLMHSISSKSIPRFLYAKSTDLTAGKREGNSKFSNLPPLDSVQSLLGLLPSISVVTLLTDSFFSDVNWAYGIPEEWFRSTSSQMWTMLQYPDQHNSEINANWLMLVFSVLACSPKHTHEDLSRRSLGVLNSDDYFMCATMARRVAEDNYLNKPGPDTSLMNSAADGTVLACFAITLLGCYLFERGRASEAWKLVGNGLRSAQSVGMHRDPDWPHWQVMSEDEKLLRRRAWWGLFISDRIYSYLLGRPSTIRNDHDVKLPSSLNPDGSHNIFNHGLAALVSLANMVSETSDTCFGLPIPAIPTFMRMDDRLVEWESHLPPEYQHVPGSSSFEGFTANEALTLARQRYMLHTWYLITRMKMFITACILVDPSQITVISRECLERGIAISLELLQFQCDTYAPISSRFAISGPRLEYVQGNDWSCAGSFSLLEASVSLMTTLGKYPLLDKVAVAENLINRGMGVFVNIARDGKSAELVAVAMQVLSSLRSQPWWKVLVEQSTKSGSGQQPVQRDTSDTLHALQSVELPTTMQVDDVSDLSGSRFPGTSSQPTLGDVRDDATLE